MRSNHDMVQCLSYDYHIEALNMPSPLKVDMSTVELQGHTMSQL